MQQTFSKKLTTRELVLIPLFSALICIGAFIKIPIGLVPVSLQTIFVLLAGILLGAKRGALAVLLYVLLGLSGLPVFTSGGGPQYILHPTFGYLLGMILAAFAAGWIAQMTRCKNGFILFGAALLGLLLIYSFGVAWLYLIKNIYMGGNVAWVPLMKAGALVFLPADTVWCALAAMVGKRLAVLSNQLAAR